MGFKRYGAPAQIELINAPAESICLCKKCGKPIAHSVQKAKIIFGASRVTITCDCGEVSSV